MNHRLQISIPRALADRYCIRAGDELRWVATGDMIRLIPPGTVTSSPRPPADTATQTTRGPVVTTSRRLKLFDAATVRQQRRQQLRPALNSTFGVGSSEVLYQHGGSD